jgi:hypothetical protein
MSKTPSTSSRIQPSSQYARFWQFKSEPVFLLGSTTDDNLFQHKNVEKELDNLVAAGGNYIRCTLSSRDSGNVQPFKKTADGRYDLEQWNEEYWRRLRHCLQVCYERDIMAQIELWAFHDFNQKPETPAWDNNPWHPDNNINYDTTNTHLKGPVGHIGRVPHDFFLSLPELGNDTILFNYQKRFIDKVLEISLPFSNVLYCMTNEIHPIYPPQWGWFWSDYVRERANKMNLLVHCTEMYWQVDFTHPQHDASYLHPEKYNFFEVSQSSFQKGDEHWLHLGAAYAALAAHPRPMNCVKIYGGSDGPDWCGSDRDGLERFWRTILAGAAGCRLHRPPYGLGGTATGNIHLTSARLLFEEYYIFNSIPDLQHHQLKDREESEAFCASIPETAKIVFFPQAGKVQLDVRDLVDSIQVQWLDINHARWYDAAVAKNNGWLSLKPPGEGYWIAHIKE